MTTSALLLASVSETVVLTCQHQPWFPTAQDDPLFLSRKATTRSNSRKTCTGPQRRLLALQAQVHVRCLTPSHLLQCQQSTPWMMLPRTRLHCLQYLRSASHQLHQLCRRDSTKQRKSLPLTSTRTPRYDHSQVLLLGNSTHHLPQLHHQGQQ